MIKASLFGYICNGLLVNVSMTRLKQLRKYAILSIIAVIIIGGYLAFPKIAAGFNNNINHTQIGSGFTYLPIVSRAEISWPMLGANPERTSWVQEEVPWELKPLWYKPFESYIPPKVQIITAYSTLYISTANGLYALDAETGAEKWVYPTELPLGHSPTVDQGVVYVGGFDRMLHAINAFTGERLWIYSAGAGFDTNPLIVNGLALLGNRDGYFYAIHTQGSEKGQLAWRYQTGGPIDYSAAYKDGVVYFASQDSRAYALRAESGSLIWKSEKLPGSGFQTWWPVVYEDWVIFSGSNNYLDCTRPGNVCYITSMDRDAVYPNHSLDPRGTLVGPLGYEPGNWAQGTPTIDTSKPEFTQNGSTFPITEYLEQKPWRRTYFVLNKDTGIEYTTDFDADGLVEYAPILWLGTHSGNRYPPVVGSDNILYQSNDYMSDQWIAGGQVSGWKIGTPFISVVSSDWNAVDEPQAYSAGGNLIYWNLCCDRESGAYNISIPNTRFSGRYEAGLRPATDAFDLTREWKYFDYNLETKIPGYSMYYGGLLNNIFLAFGGRNGVYGVHGVQNPPIPYQGKVYMHRGNSVIAFAPRINQATQLPMATILPYDDPDMEIPPVDSLRLSLITEVQKIIDTGHLRPGYFSVGLIDQKSNICGDDLLATWHNPGDTINTLISALPYLPSDLHLQLREYIQTEFLNYPPYLYSHIGWRDGEPREPFILPPEVEADRLLMGPQEYNLVFSGWDFSPMSFYVLWKYAQVFGGAQELYIASIDRLEPVPPDDYLAINPGVHNAFIAGYLGFLELEELAGYPETSHIRDEYNRILALRMSGFSKDNPDLWFQDLYYYYCRTFSVSRNFIYMVPELAQYLYDNIYSQVDQAIEEYTYIAPYWFEAKSETALGEGAINHFYDYLSIFAAKAMILQEPYNELAKYIDIPAAPIGDLFYIQNLILAIKAGSQ